MAGFAQLRSNKGKTMTQNTSSTNILIIEDEIAIAEGLVDLCELNGYSVKHVADGESGLNEALTGQYGLVLLDLMLPGMDGFTVCDKIREKDKNGHGSIFLGEMLLHNRTQAA